MEFIKMHGLGNDFILLDCMAETPAWDPAALARQLCRRNFSVGADGLVLALPSSVADARMRIFNPDGSEPEMCGNAIRCLARFLCDEGYVSGDALSIETLAGVLFLSVSRPAKAGMLVSVDMGVPEITGEITLPIAGQSVPFTLVSTGNPHAVTYDLFPNQRLFQVCGPLIEHDPAFPQGVNVEFCLREDAHTVRVLVWERGAGPTLACGTGATAAFCAGLQRGLIASPAEMQLPGGTLRFERTENGHVIMTGPAEEAFRGQINLASRESV